MASQPMLRKASTHYYSIVFQLCVAVSSRTILLATHTLSFKGTGKELTSNESLRPGRIFPVTFSGVGGKLSSTKSRNERD